MMHRYLSILTACLLFTSAALRAQTYPEQRFAIVIGITGYPEFPEDERLNYADDDARLFAETLRRPECGGFEEENIILLVNEEATLKKISNAISSLSSRITRDDLLYFFFAGHGVVSNAGRKYLMPHDAPKENPLMMGLEVERLLPLLNENLDFNNLVCIIDACHAGTAGDPYSRGSDNIVNSMMKSMIGDSTFTVMGFYSCTGTQFSYEDPELEHGLFTWYLVQAMKGEADLGRYGDRNGIVDAREAFNFIHDSVRARSRMKGYGAQTPTQSGLNPSFRFSQYAVSLPPPPPPPPPPSLDSARALVRQGRIAFEQGSRRRAIELFNAAIILHPALDTAHYNLGVALMDAGKVTDAIASFRRATDLNPLYARAYGGLGAALLGSGAIEEATFELTRATALAPKDAAGHYYLGNALALSGDPEGGANAMEVFASLTEDSTRSAKALHIAARLRRVGDYLREGRRLVAEDEPGDALRQFYNVLRLDPISAIALYEIGKIHYLNGAFEKAIEYLNHAVRFNWELAGVHYLLASSYDNLEKYVEAIAEYKMYLEMMPDGKLAKVARQRVEVLERRVDK